MACLTLSSLNTTTSFSFKSSSTQVPKSRNRNHRRHAVIVFSKHLRKTLHNDDDNDDQNIRRNDLVGLGGLYTFSKPVVKDSFPANLYKPIKVLVPRPKKLRSEKEKEEEEEVLVIEGIEVKSDVFVKFDVLVNYEDDEVSATADKTEFVGSYMNLPHGNMRNMKMKLTIGISELLEHLEAEKDDKLLVTVVPRNGEVTISGIKIEYEHK